MRRSPAIEVIPVGAIVLAGIVGSEGDAGKIVARVTGVCIREHGHVTYECSWWDGRTRHSKWLEPFEVQRTDGSQGGRRIGIV